MTAFDLINVVVWVIASSIFGSSFFLGDAKLTRKITLRAAIQALAVAVMLLWLIIIGSWSSFRALLEVVLWT